MMNMRHMNNDSIKFILYPDFFHETWLGAFDLPNQNISEGVFRLGVYKDSIGDKKWAEKCYWESVHGRFEADTINEVGIMYADGLNVAKDVARGCALFEAAYDMGFRNIRCGDYLMMGTYHQFDVDEGIHYGLNRDMDLAVKWYRKVAEIDKYGFTSLGHAYLEREIRDYSKAFKYFVMGGNDNEKNLYYLGVMYEFGLYVKPNPVIAFSLFNQIKMNETYAYWAKKRLKELHGGEIPLTHCYFEYLMDHNMI